MGTLKLGNRIGDFSFFFPPMTELYFALQFGDGKLKRKWQRGTRQTLFSGSDHLGVNKNEDGQQRLFDEC